MLQGTIEENIAFGGHAEHVAWAAKAALTTPSLAFSSSAIPSSPQLRLDGWGWTLSKASLR